MKGFCNIYLDKESWVLFLVELSNHLCNASFPDKSCLVNGN
jgi:hypothetical protein